ncbi:urease accessory UreF family protein [Planosporangium thailandense]|uniref:urease accessory UreF family protein n=1 Tax=Planosporangium thailandense TaxID=765197 RepID=UPI00197BFD4E
MAAPAAPGEGFALPPFLAALQLADSAFPSGRYTLSHGLESFVQSGEVTARSGVRGLWSLLTDQLEHGIATADGVASAWAHRAVSESPDPDRYDEQLALTADLRLSSVKLSREAREASARTGRGVLGTTVGSFAGPALTAYARLVDRGAAPGNGAVVTGILAAELAVPLPHSVATELYAFTAGWLNAAVRLGVADHRVAQAVLHRCGPVIDRTVRRACETGLDGLSSSTPLADVMSMRHEQATLRLFMS